MEQKEENGQSKNTFFTRLRRLVDGEADTFFEYFMLLVVIVNTVVLGLETSPGISEKYGRVLWIVDQVCLWIFIAELLLKIVAFNRHFFGEYRKDEDGSRFFHVNKWNIFDLAIVLVSVFASLPFFAVFRLLRLFKSVKIIRGIKSLRVVKTLKLVNGITKLRVIVKAVIKAIPSVLWTFCLLVIFAYVYAIIGVNIFGADFPENFGSLGSAFLSLFNLSGFDSSEVIKRFSWSWIYFISYNFFEASIIMNVIVGVIVDSVNSGRKEIEEEDKRESSDKSKENVTLESLSDQIAELQKEMRELKKNN
ncbi:MAG: ion transporter [Treponema sp.]|nr:ion transporter [Treponema sp.]